MKAFSFAFLYYYYCKVFSFNAVKCVCHSYSMVVHLCSVSGISPYSKATRQSKSSSKSFYGFISYSEVSNRPGDGSLWFASSDELFFLTWSNGKTNSYKKTIIFHSLYSHHTKKKMWGWNKGPSVDRSFAKLSLLFLWSDNCPFIDPPFYITVALQ